MVMPIAGVRRGRRARASRFSTSPWRFCAPGSRISSPFGAIRCPLCIRQTRSSLRSNVFLKPLNTAPDYCTSAPSFYKETLRHLAASGVPFLVGGTFALREYTPVVRDTKDLDVFLKPVHQGPAMDLFRKLGYAVEMTALLWITKVFCGSFYVDFIF